MMEVLIAIAALSIACMGVMSVLTFGLAAGDMAGTYTAANQLGREIVENIRVDRYSLNAFDPPPGLVDASESSRRTVDAPPFAGPSTSVRPDPRFTRNIAITEVDEDRLARIQVRLYWIQNGKEKMVETVAFLRSGQ